MEYIKRKRLLENYILRGDSPNYGLILNEKTDDLGNPIKDSLGNNIENTIDIDLFITHNYEDMGIMSDEDYIPFDPNYIGLSDTNQKYLGKRYQQSLLPAPTNFNPAIDGRHPSVKPSGYNQPSVTISGETDDRNLVNVKSYKVDINNNPIYKPFLNMSNDIKKSFNGVIFNTPTKINYVLGGSVDSLGNYKTNTGVIYETFLNDYVTKRSDGGKIERWKKTLFQYTSNGMMLTDTPDRVSNAVLSATTKVEEYFNVVSPPEVVDNVFINRGGEDIFERHAIMSEIKTRNDIDEYREKYF